MSDSVVDQDPAFEVFHPYAASKTRDAEASGQRFVHYTGAETVMGIIRSRRVWMRKSSTMNDLMEIEHGLDCLRSAYAKHKDRFSTIFERLFPDFAAKLEGHFNGWLPRFRNDTYISSMSEHDTSEDKLGRLSMWRAYGGRCGVAVVMNQTPFFTPSDALHAYTSPVAYLDEDTFGVEFARLLDSIEERSELVSQMGEEAVFARMFEVFRAAVLCTKHPGFREEREWRIIYSPSYAASEIVEREVVSINGVPQPICKLPLENFPDGGFYGAAIPDLVERVIIGPTEFPRVVRESLIEVLRDAGVPDPDRRVFVSDIPLRQ